MRFQVLGPLKVEIDGTDVPVAGVRSRALLATLLLNAGTTVSCRELIVSLWGVAAPPSALSSLRNLVARLRETLGDSTARRLRTVGSGYLIDADRDELDLLSFIDLCAQGRAAHERGQWQACADALRSALALWTGEPFDGITGSVQITDACHRLEEQRLQALRWRIDAELELGRHEAAIADLRSLTGLYPLDEHFHGQLMTALYRSGRQADALAVYRNVRELISEELGVEPGTALRRLHQRILTADSALAPAGSRAPRRERDTGHAHPRQLPAAVGHFVGREAELKALRETAARGGAVVISAISGTAGVGKTALAVRFAHEVADRFPDGQLYANLRGFDPASAPSDPLAVARGFLEALGVAPAAVPTDPDALLALYRSKLANTRTLILLDNARDTNQVRPLMPGADSCLVLVTSRNTLTGLVALDGATPLTLNLFTAQEAGELLTRRLGAERTAGEPDAAAHLARLCASLPLALNIAAARAAAHPRASLRSVADQLGDTQRRLDALSAEEGGVADVRSVFSWSYQTLDEPAALMFRLLGLHPGPDISAAAAASLSGLAPDEARTALADLVRAHLIAEPIPGHYAFHDLLRAYAVELANEHATDDERHQAKRRMFDHYLHSAYHARRALQMGSQLLVLEPPCPGVTPEDFADLKQARAWFRTEHTVLIAICALAAESGFVTHAWQLPWAIISYLDGAGYWTDMETISRRSLAVAERAGDLTGVAHGYRQLGYVQIRRSDYDGGLAHYEKALALFKQLGERAFEAALLEVVAWAMRYQNRATEALAHDEQAMEIYEALGKAGRHPWIVIALGLNHAMLGNHQAALAYFLSSLSISRKMRNPYAEAAALHGIGTSRLQLGDYAAAVSIHLDELALRREIGDYYYEAEALQTLGDAYLASRDAAAARGAWEQALVIYDDLKHSDADAVRVKLRELDANVLAGVDESDRAAASYASSARD